MEIWEALQYEYIQRALMAATFVGISCGILGVFIVLRNMSLIGDALSHAVLPGIVVGFWIAGYSLIGFFTGAVIAGFLAAFLIGLIHQYLKTKEDAAIGIVFTAMFAIGVMGISYLSKQDGVHLDLKDFLFGNILGVSTNDLWLTGAICLYIIICISIFFRYFFIVSFQPTIASTLGISVNSLHYFLMLLLSFTVVASLQSVGVILVVAMLIIPASTAQMLTDRLRNMLVISAAFGTVAAVGGMLAAIYLETVPGPAMTLTSTALFLIVAFIAPEKGLLTKYLISRKRKQKIIEEDMIKFLVKQKKPVPLQNLLELFQPLAPKSYTKQVLKKLLQKNWIEKKGGIIQLLPEGLMHSFKLIRAHRLWETYQVKKMGLSEDRIHEMAEKYEHDLPKKLIDRIDISLGNPCFDPHGSPIPPTMGKIVELNEMEKNQFGILSLQENSPEILLKLQQKSFTPHILFKFAGKEDGKYKLILEEKPLFLEADLARQIFIRPVLTSEIEAISEKDTENTKSDEAHF